MATLAKRSVIILWWLAISGLAPGQNVGEATSSSLAQGWTRVPIPAPSAPSSPGPGSPIWLLPFRGGLVAIGFGYGCCPPQQVPTEWTSSDGKNWQRFSVPPTIFGAGRITAVAAGRPGLVAVGSRLASGPPKPGPIPVATWFSPNGRTWRKASPIGNAFDHSELLAVTASGTGFVAVGDIQSQGDEFHPFSVRMAVWLSSDGSRWRLASDSSSVFLNASASAVLHGGEGLVAMGASGQFPGSGPTSRTVVWTSPNGRVWRRVPQTPGVFPIGSNFHLLGAVGENSHYVAWGSDFAEVPHYLVWTSTDGAHWRQAPGIHFQYGQVNSIAPHGVGFVAVGQRDNEPALWSSLDGARWASVVGENVFGGGNTWLGGALDWQGGIVVAGYFDRPPTFNPSPMSDEVATPSVWLWRPGVRRLHQPQWARIDPKWFRLRIEDLPSGFHVQTHGPSGYGIGCALAPDSFLRDVGALRRVPTRFQSDVASPCLKAIAALSPGSTQPYYYRFPYGAITVGNTSENAPYVGGFAILAQRPAQAQAAFQYADGLVHAIDLNLNRVAPKPIRSLAIGQGAELFSQKISSPCPAAPPQCPPFAQGGTAYAVVWWDGRALGVVEVIGVPLDREALAIMLAQRQWARYHAFRP